MIIFIAKKILYLSLMLFFIAAISFCAVQLAPNSFFASGELNPNITPETIQNMRLLYGFDKPLIVQFVNWFMAITHLDFGVSFASGELVKEEILKRIHITLAINIISLIVIFGISIFLGIISALKKDSVIDKIVTQSSLISFSMPAFYVALLSVFIFSIWLDILPIAGLHSDINLKGISYYLDFAHHLILPIGIIIFGSFGSLTLYIRSLTFEILKSDYIFFAKSRGITKKQMLRFYILPNLSPQIITLLGLSLPGIIGGSVILESIFSIDGMGFLFFQAALSHDYPVVMGILIIGAFLTLLGNMVADLVLLKFNPHFKQKTS